MGINWDVVGKVERVNLEEQVEKEAEAIRTAPVIHNMATGQSGRCHFCGAITRNLQFVERVGDPPQDRYRGEECCGH